MRASSLSQFHKATHYYIYGGVTRGGDHELSVPRRKRCWGGRSKDLGLPSQRLGWLLHYACLTLFRSSGMHLSTTKLECDFYITQVSSSSSKARHSITFAPELNMVTWKYNVHNLLAEQILRIYYNQTCFGLSARSGPVASYGREWIPALFYHSTLQFDAEQSCMDEGKIKRTKGANKEHAAGLQWFTADHAIDRCHPTSWSGLSFWEGDKRCIKQSLWCRF